MPSQGQTQENLSERNFYKTFISSTSGSTGECDCGRLCFDAIDQWDEDHSNQLDSFMEKAKEFPDNYSQIEGRVESIEFADRNYVIGCRCKQYERIKSALDISAVEIAKYLNLESARLKEHANNTAVAGGDNE